MQATMGEDGPRSVLLGTMFGFVSSSCSFAALSATRALFAKGAGLAPALAFLLASTNLVVELGVIIAIFLGWQFVVGEYAGGILLILFTWLAVRLTRPHALIEGARRRAREKSGDGDDEEVPDWRRLITTREGWGRVAERYVAEWTMVWKDVAIGFTVAGVIAVFVPKEFFEALFVGAGATEPSLPNLLAQSLIGPLAAFFTFIGSMGNIPLAAVLFDNGVSFAGVMAFIFSDLVVLPVLRIQASYYGWRMALYILIVFLAALVATAVVLHYAFAALDVLPDPATAKPILDRDHFSIGYAFALNIVFGVISIVFVAASVMRNKPAFRFPAVASERLLLFLAAAAFAWLAIGAAIL